MDVAYQAQRNQISKDVAGSNLTDMQAEGKVKNFNYSQYKKGRSNRAEDLQAFVDFIVSTVITPN